MTPKVCVITGSRAEYGLLRWVMQGIKEDPSLTLQVIATGMHLSPRFGNTYQEIEEDGFLIDYKVAMLSEDNSGVGVARSMGTGMRGLADALDKLKPDLAIVLGDRFEIMTAAQALVILQIPVVHLCGGDVGSGTFDNIFRDCISLMSNLHCVTHSEAKLRLIEMGIPRENIYNFGATSVDAIRKLNYLTFEELKGELGLFLNRDFIVVTFHPLTHGGSSASTEIRELLLALDAFRDQSEVSIIFTGTNADPGGTEFTKLIDQFIEKHNNCHAFQSLGHFRYLNLVKHAMMVVGNSSSGIYEAPYLGTPTINIGIRQRGRKSSNSVFHCDALATEILNSMNFVLNNRPKSSQMVYGDGTASEKIVGLVKSFLSQKTEKPEKRNA
jgi:UDP-hydrolysing UDP-N-acetyl-D-glucosamine 2-epimerase